MHLSVKNKNSLEKDIAFFYNLKQLLISIDQLIQVIIGCVVSLFLWNHRIDADETMSAYCYRHRGTWYGHAMEIFVNCLMYIPEKLLYGLPWGHCARAYQSEVEGRYRLDH